MKTSVHPNNIEQNNANKHITKKESISLFSGTPFDPVEFQEQSRTERSLFAKSDLFIN